MFCIYDLSRVIQSALDSLVKRVYIHGLLRMHYADANQQSSSSGSRILVPQIYDRGIRCNGIKSTLVSLT